MGAMRAQSKLYLYKHFVGIDVARVVCPLILPANLRELAGPVGQHQRSAFVVESRVKRAIGTVEASSDKPAPRKLIVGGCVVTERTLKSRRKVRRTYDGHAGINSRLV